MIDFETVLEGLPEDEKPAWRVVEPRTITFNNMGETIIKLFRLPRHTWHCLNYIIEHGPANLDFYYERALAEQSYSIDPKRKIDDCFLEVIYACYFRCLRETGGELPSLIEGLSDPPEFIEEPNICQDKWRDKKIEIGAEWHGSRQAFNQSVTRMLNERRDSREANNNASKNTTPFFTVRNKLEWQAIIEGRIEKDEHGDYLMKAPDVPRTHPRAFLGSVNWAQLTEGKSPPKAGESTQPAVYKEPVDWRDLCQGKGPEKASDD